MISCNYNTLYNDIGKKDRSEIGNNIIIYITFVCCIEYHIQPLILLYIY